MTGADIALTLLISALNHASEIGALIQKARDEGRDVTDAELDGLRAKDDQAKADLTVAIAKARAG